MLDLSSIYADAFSYDDFLQKYGTPDQRNSWQRYFDSQKLTQPQRDLLGSFKREMRVLCMAGAWCGDCIQQCPVFRHFELAAPVIKLRFVDRDADEDLKSKLTICGGARVPQVVFMSEDGKNVGWYGDRTLAKYRAMYAMQAGDSCSTGIAGAGSRDLEAAVLQDWLDEFERAQLILRLSPSLRQKHGD
jgi:hypothetical protein